MHTLEVKLPAPGAGEVCSLIMLFLRRYIRSQFEFAELFANHLSVDFVLRKSRIESDIRLSHLLGG